MARLKTYLLMPSGTIAKMGQWDTLKSTSPDAWNLKKFEDRRLSLELTARDRIHTDGVIPAEHWLRFDVSVKNIIVTDFEGNQLDKPKYVEDTDATGAFRTLEEAETHYQTFLARYTACNFNGETGKFEEVGNKFNPDIPKPVADSPKAKEQDFGSW